MIEKYWLLVALLPTIFGGLWLYGKGYRDGQAETEEGRPRAQKRTAR